MIKHQEINYLVVHHRLGIIKIKLIFKHIMAYILRYNQCLQLIQTENVH
jgi:hypothetical protein